MPKKVEECVKSVLEDNPDYSEARAYAICNAEFECDVDADDVIAESLAETAESVDCQQECLTVEQQLDALAYHDATSWVRRADEQGIAWVDTENAAVVYQQDSYTDYPEAAKENARTARQALEDTGNPNDCLTEVGRATMNILADEEGVSRDRLGKIAAFERFEEDKEMDDDEGRADCGWISWRAWGGDEGIAWAQNKLDELEESDE